MQYFVFQCDLFLVNFWTRNMSPLSAQSRSHHHNDTLKIDERCNSYSITSLQNFSTTPIKILSEGVASKSIAACRVFIRASDPHHKCRPVPVVSLSCYLRIFPVFSCVFIISEGGRQRHYLGHPDTCLGRPPYPRYQTPPPSPPPGSSRPTSLFFHTQTSLGSSTGVHTDRIIKLQQPWGIQEVQIINCLSLKANSKSLHLQQKIILF